MSSAVKNQSNIWSYALLALVVTGLAYIIYTQLDYQIEEVDRGYQDEARTNSYLAAEYFLRDMGQAAEKITLFAENRKTLSHQDTLLVTGNRLAFDKRRSEEILKWVEDGGHLIITAKARSDVDDGGYDHLLNIIGLQVTMKVNDDGVVNDDLPVNLDIIDEDEFWQVDFTSYHTIEITGDFKYDSIWKIENNGKLHGLQVSIGDGVLTLLSDLGIFRNERIERYDHAAFLLTLANDQYQEHGEGIFYYSIFEEYISLWQWLWDNARPLMISICILIFTILMFIIPRFGPVINIKPAIRRNFKDHLTASGNYHWRQGRYSKLLFDVRIQLNESMKLKQPGWLSLSRSDQLDRFVSSSQLPVEEIESALFDNNVDKIDDFTQKIKILEKLRGSL